MAPQHALQPHDTAARAFGLRPLAEGIASDIEAAYERTRPELHVRVRGYHGKHTGRVWWIASWQDGDVVRIARADLSAAELGDLPMLDVANIARRRIDAGICGI